MIEKNYITSEGYKKLKAELLELKDVDRGEIAAKIKEARDMGNVMENTTYDALIEDQNQLENKIQELENILAKSEIVDDASAKSDQVVIGSKVVVEFEGKKDEFTIVGSAEADPLKRYISNESPVGKAILGAKIGDIVGISTPVFKVEYKVLEIK